MNSKKQNMIVIVATLISLATYLFWSLMPKGSFYIGNAIFIILITGVLFSYKKNFINFFLFSIALNNLADELFFDNTKLGWSELTLLIIIPLIYALHTRNKKRNL